MNYDPYAISYYKKPVLKADPLKILLDKQRE